MHILHQDIFEPASAPSLANEALVVHRHPARTNEALVIFVHGLGGSRYATWGDFPKYIFKDFAAIDVGLYSYRTLFRRWKLWESVSLETESSVIAGIIRLLDYKLIILVGHSMGGLLCQSAICSFIHANDLEPLRRVGGLILMATPQAGSMWVARILSFFSKDFYALLPHGEFVTRIQSTFCNYLSLDEGDARRDKTLLPTWAILGSYDFWVDRFSAGLSLPDRRKILVRGAHTEIVKPEKGAREGSEAYKFVRRALEMCLDKRKPRPSCYTDDEHRIAVILSQLELLCDVADKMSSELHEWVIENQKILNVWRRKPEARRQVATQMRDLYENQQNRARVEERKASVEQIQKQLDMVYADYSDIHEIVDRLDSVLGRIAKILYGDEFIRGDDASMTKLRVVASLEARINRNEVTRIVEAYLGELRTLDDEVARLAGRLKAIRRTQGLMTA